MAVPAREMVVRSGGVEQEMLRLLDANGGRLSPEAVLESARDVDSPLHTHFEWDDAKASEAFRLVQAAGLIRRVKLTVTVAERDPVRVQLTATRIERPVRAIISDPALRGSDGGSYVARSAVSRETLLKEALVALENTRRRFADVGELAPVWDAIEVVAGEVR